MVRARHLTYAVAKFPALGGKSPGILTLLTMHTDSGSVS